MSIALIKFWQKRTFFCLFPSFIYIREKTSVICKQYLDLFDNHIQFSVKWYALFQATW